MQDYIRKYFWVVGVIAVVACASLAALAVNNYVAGKFLADSAEPAKAPVQRQARRPRPSQHRSKAGEPLAKRNIFCSDCEPEEPVPGDGDPTDPDAVPYTSLPLQLVATNISGKPENSFATIRNTQTDSQGAYWVDNKIPGVGSVVKIAGKYVDFVNDSSKRRERVALLRRNKPAVAKAEPRPTRPRRGKNSELAELMDDSIKKVDDNSYEIDRSLVDKVLANPMSVARGARIVPSVKNGQANGFKLYAIRPSSVYAKIGLRNGDTIHSINGYDLTTPDKALEVYTKVKEASNLSVTVTRRGKPVTLTYGIK